MKRITLSFCLLLICAAAAANMNFAVAQASRDRTSQRAGRGFSTSDEVDEEGKQQEGSEEGSEVMEGNERENPYERNGDQQ